MKLHELQGLMDIIGSFEKLAVENRSPDGKFGYHVTYYRNLSEIARNGLNPQGGGQSLGVGGYAGHSKGSVFLTEKGGIPFWFQRMEEMAEASSDNVLDDGMIPVVLKFQWPNALTWDEAGSQDASNDAFMTEQGIDSKNIQVYNRGWIPIENWQALDPKNAVEEDEQEDIDTGETVTYYYLSSFSPFQP